MSSGGGGELLDPTAETRFLVVRLKEEFELGFGGKGTGPLPASLTTGVGHGEVSLPEGATPPFAQGTRPRQRVTATLRTVQGDVLFLPRYSTPVTGTPSLSCTHRKDSHIRIIGKRLT
jgi:hypothetical protein